MAHSPKPFGIRKAKRYFRVSAQGLIVSYGSGAALPGKRWRQVFEVIDEEVYVRRVVLHSIPLAGLLQLTEMGWLEHQRPFCADAWLAEVVNQR